MKTFYRVCGHETTEIWTWYTKERNFPGNINTIMTSCDIFLENTSPRSTSHGPRFRSVRTTVDLGLVFSDKISQLVIIA